MKKSLCKHYPDAAALLLRVGLAAIFIPHGWAKIQDVDQFVQFVGTIGLGAPVAYFVLLLELVGGLMLLLGVFTEYVAWLIAAEMLVIVTYVKPDAGYIGGNEFEYLILFVAVVAALLGPGNYALEKRWKKSSESSEGKAGGADHVPDDEEDA